MTRVLIVDDKPENLYLLRALLQGNGCTVDEARHGAEALTIARQAPPDLIISDVLMPVMDGYTLLRRWKADERLQTIPFVVYTATYTEPKDERLALALGADAFIIKPLEPEPFMTRIKEILAKEESGELPPATFPLGDEMGLIKEYSEVLVRKLEKKAFELEQVNRALQEDIAQRHEAEVALRMARRDWENIFQAIGHPTIVMDMEHGIVAANKAAVKVSGKSLDKLLNAKCYEIFHKNNQPPQLCPMEALLESGALETVEMEMEALGGHYLVSCTPVIDEEGGVQKVIHIATDISERKRSEKALRESEEQFRSLFENSLDAILLTIPDGRILRANPAARQMFGMTEEEICRAGRDGLVDTSDPRLKQALEERDRTGKFQGELLITRKDGTVFPAELSTVLFRDVEGQWKSTMIIRDVDARRRSEEAQKRLATAVEQAAEGIVITDRAGTILYVNPAFEVTTGYTSEEAIGKNPRILKSGMQDRAFYREMWSTLTRGEVWRGRLINKRKDGGIYEETATISPIKDKTGRIINYVAVKRDLTAELILQKQLFQAQKMEAIGTLAGGIAHDFNNLLQIILGYTDLLLMQKDPVHPDLQKVEVIHRAARDGAELVSRILTFSRKAESKARPIDLNEEIRRAEKLLRRTVPKMIEIKLALADELRIIDADPAQMEQLLLNLAVNAQHAMPDGGDFVIETSNASMSDQYLRTHLGVKPGQYVRLTVSDTGIGMPPEVLDRVFEPFFTTKTNGEGTGLGLAMVHGIVSQNGGHIRCYSEPGMGTSFNIYFPVSETERPRELTETREMPAFGSETILLVDDDDCIRKMAQEMIQRHGYQVLVAHTGEEALEIFPVQKDRIALVILDLIMPGMGGKKCLEELLRIDPNVRVLIASGYSSGGLTEYEKGSGAKGFINKPYDAKDILKAIREVLDRDEL